MNIIKTILSIIFIILILAEVIVITINGIIWLNNKDEGMQTDKYVINNIICTIISLILNFILYILLN